MTVSTLDAVSKGAALAERAAAWLHLLTTDLPTRTTGTAGNRTACEFFERTVVRAGCATVRQEFACIDWDEQGATLAAGGTVFELFPAPWTLGTEITAPLGVCATVEEVEQGEWRGRILLLRTPLAAGQIMPKNFVFWNPDEHKRIYAALEAAAPAAVLTATAPDPGMAGGIYPLPMIEDGDFDIPTAYLTEEEGARLSEHAGEDVALTIRAARTPSHGWNVVARKNPGAAQRIVCMAHIDAKRGTPGATDNATGVVTLLLLAELLAGYDGPLGIELVPVNGEDNYASPGELAWLRANEERLGDILLAINIDGIGSSGKRTAWSLYGCPPEMAARIEGALAVHPTLAVGPEWYQSDHAIFVQMGIPALALTSEDVSGWLASIVHTAQDTPAVVDVDTVVAAALALRDVVGALDILR